MKFFANHWLKRFMIIIGIIFVALAAMSLYLEYKTPYENDYWGKLGIGRNKGIYGYRYKEMLDDFGEPLNIIKTGSDSIRVTYDDMIFTFWGDSPKASVVNIEVLSEKYRFGYRSIGVGSSKKDVFKAYEHIQRSPDEGYVWKDGDAFVVFTFENDVVKTIRIFYGV